MSDAKIMRQINVSVFLSTLAKLEISGTVEDPKIEVRLDLDQPVCSRIAGVVIPLPGDKEMPNETQEELLRLAAKLLCTRVAGTKVQIDDTEAFQAKARA